MSVNVGAYLNRIGITGAAAPDVPTLRAIHWAHLQTVPFENLDIRPLRLPISLDLAAIEEKIVHRHRGGFCYELNGLLAEVLTEIGFEVTRVSVQFVREGDQLSPPFDHIGLLVRPVGADTRLFADIGGGRGSPAFPIPLLHGHQETQPETGFGYRFEHVGDNWRFDLRESDADWMPQQVFTEQPCQLGDFTDRCHYQWNDPDSHFTQGPLCTRNLPGGRITIANNTIIRTQGAYRTVEPLPDDASLHRALLEHFNIRLS